MSRDLFWIPGPWRGRLAVTMRPRGGDWLEDEVARWHRAGLDVVVSLLEAEEAAEFELIHEGKAAETKGLEFSIFPIPDRDVPSSMPATLALMRKLAGALEDGKHVALHCRQGIGRSGLIAAGLLVWAGTPVEQAIETVSRARGRAIPETPNQLRWLHRFASQRQAEMAVAEMNK